MLPTNNKLVDLLAGKTPEAMYDSLHAGRYLSSEGLRSPQGVLDLIKSALRSSRQRVLVLETLATILVDSGFLNEAGELLVHKGPGEQ